MWPMTSEWNYDEALSHEDMTLVCQQKRDQLQELLFVEHPDLEDVWPAQVVEDALLFCGFHVVDEPLPSNQLALCDMGQKLVIVNSQTHLFLHKWSNVQYWRWVTLAHELGHVVLHYSEINQRIFRSYQTDSSEFTDSRAAQKEYEADLFSRVMLVPEELLLAQREASYFLKARAERRVVKPAHIANWIRRLSGRFKVTSPLMRQRLEDLGWLQKRQRKKKWKDDLLLCFGEDKAYD